MLTLTPCIRTSRAGRTQLKIRASVNNTTAYIDTPFYVDPEILTKGGEITDKRTRQRVDAFIDAIWRKLEGYDLITITAKEVKDIAGGNADRGISFPRYARDYIIKREREGLKRWDGYDDAVRHLSKFMGKKDYTFGDLSVRTLQAWMDTLQGTKRISVVYPMFIKKIWTSAMREYNDPDRGVFRIKEFPSEYLLKPAPAPSASRTQAQALSSDEVYSFATTNLDAGGEYAHAVAMLSFCLAGINVADLYDLTADSYKDGKICYYRAKTRGKRTDDAYMEVTVHERAKPYLELLMQGAEPGKLLSLSARYRVRREVPNYLRKSQTLLTPKEIVQQAQIFLFTNPETGRPDSPLGIGDPQRDVENARIKMWGEQVISEKGELVDYFIDIRDLRILGMNDVIIGYVPNKVMEEAEKNIRRAYSEGKYDEVYRLFQEAYTAIPITTDEWKALKEKGEQ